MRSLTVRAAVAAVIGLASWPTRAEPLKCAAVHRQDVADAGVDGVRCRPYVYPRALRVLAGVGSVPLVAGSSANLGVDYSPHSFSGSDVRGGALATGLSASFDFALDGRWLAVAPGLFVQVDLTYLALSRLLVGEPPSDFPVRVQVGSRLGIGLTRSFPPRDVLPWASPYFLIRPEVRWFLNLEFPLDRWRVYSFVLSGALDTRASQSGVLRWSICAGLSWGSTHD
jgi:hypothetical protein